MKHIRTEKKVEKTKTNMTIEQVDSVIMTDETNRPLIPQPRPIRRFASSVGRHYAVLTEDSRDVHIIPSATTICKDTMQTGDPLIMWIAQLGFEESRRVMREKAAYGTYMHCVFEKALIKGSLSKEDVSAVFTETITDNEEYVMYTHKKDEWTHQAWLDGAAFMQFCNDYRVKPIAIELCLADENLMAAGAIDLVCTMEVIEKEKYLDSSNPYTRGPRKGQPREATREILKKYNCIIDYKSGRKGFWDSHELQLHIYKWIFEANFPEFTIDKVYNFSPKDWRSKPTYNLKDQTDSKHGNTVKQVCDLFNARHTIQIKPSESLPDVITIGEEINMEVFDEKTALLESLGGDPHTEDESEFGLFSGSTRITPKKSLIEEIDDEPF